MIVTSNAAFWLHQASLPVLDRIGAAPEELLQYVAAANNSSQPPASAGEFSPDFMADVRAAIAEMPATVLALLDKPLLGVYFGRELGSSAITDVVTTTSAQVLGLVVMVDIAAFFKRSANDWASWKENTPFLDDSPYRLRLQIEASENDNRKNALQFLLLHEFGHVLSAQSEFLPDWWIGMQRFKSTEEYSFLSLCWQIAMSGEIIPLLRHDFQHRKSLHFYSTEQVSSLLIPEIYQSLEKTAFPSLYAATNAYDDFAESFAIYVHSVVMHKPYRLQICSGSKVLGEIPDYWASGRASAKKRLFAELLDN